MIWTGPNDAPLTTKEERMDKLRNAPPASDRDAELIARFRKLAIFDPDFDRAADLIEQQAKELAEAQARVVVLKRLLNSAGVALNAWHMKENDYLWRKFGFDKKQPPPPTEENEMSEASVREFVLTATATEITNRIEQQAKELAEAQARVVALESALIPLAALKDNPFFGNFKDLFEAAGKVLASTDTAAQTLREKWIPVSERLPEPDTYVLYYNGKYTGFGKWVSGEWCESDERWQTDFGEYIELLGPKITHWQPLPEPPKEKP